ncbi:MAG TPA: maleylpyruvate isomerase family mycothiol-dependent enzyme, partial [Ilumatobacteraceae bacterium]
MTITADERRQLCDTFADVGPDEPTLCGDWSTRDLLAHLLVRERRPDGALGIAVPVLAKRTRQIMDSYASKPWDEMIEEFRGGAPLWSFFALPVV